MAPPATHAATLCHKTRCCEVVANIVVALVGCPDFGARLMINVASPHPNHGDNRVPMSPRTNLLPTAGQPPAMKPRPVCKRFNNLVALLKTLVESKTRTYHGRVGSGRTAGRRGGVGQGWVLTEFFAQETRAPRTLQSIEETTPERPPRSTNKRNLM